MVATGQLPDRRMREAAWPRGYRLDHRARQIRGYDLDDFDIVIGMDDNNMYDLDRLADTQEAGRPSGAHDRLRRPSPGGRRGA